MKAILFDLGHTLIDYYVDWETPENRSIKRFYDAVMDAGADAKEDEFTRFVKGLLDDGRKKKRVDMVEIPLETVLTVVLERYEMEEDDQLVVEGCDIFYDSLAEKKELAPGTIDMLERVKGKGYRIGLVSDVAWGLPSDYPLKDLEQFGLDCYFDDLVFSTEVGLRKPHPKMFKLSLYNLGAKAEESFFIGNSIRCDIKGANGVGIRSILKESGHPEDEDGVVPKFKIKDWDELDQYID
ncbi:MAG: HAD family hydrolase [Euryarchaeota archaeon]|nr:HAD family hydrolase [Euryarchaeota archaeon]